MTTPAAQSATPSSTPPSTRFGRRQMKGLLLGYSAPVVVTVGAGLLTVAVSLFVARGLGLLACSPLWAVLLAAGFVRWQGAPIVEALPLIVVWQIRKATGQTRYRVKASEPRPAGTMGLPGDAAALRFYDDPASGVANREQLRDAHTGVVPPVGEPEQRRYSKPCRRARHPVTRRHHGRAAFCAPPGSFSHRVKCCTRLSISLRECFTM